MTFIGEIQVMKFERPSLYTPSIWNALLNFRLPVAGLLNDVIRLGTRISE